jgi:hypothetical protein
MRKKALAVIVAFGCTVVPALPSEAHPLQHNSHGRQARVCVEQRHACFTTVQAAVDAAHDGDVIQIGPGTYVGGVIVDVSVSLIGSGAKDTIISGGGPVLTIGVPDAATEPTVTIQGITVANGRTVGNLTPHDGRGGGIYIPRAAGPATGATVTIRHSIIRDNEVAPRIAIDSADVCAAGHQCQDASAGGGGISNDGHLTVEHTAIVRNRASGAAGLTSQVTGGGIISRAFGWLTLRDSLVADNAAQATAPNGRFANGGGIFMGGNTLTIERSRISGNTASVSSALPPGVDQHAIAGGVQVIDSASGTIGRAAITDNTVSAVNALGEATAFSGGIHADGPLTLTDSSVNRNEVIARTLHGSRGNANADSGGGEINATATISRTEFIGNRVVARSSTGNAGAGAGAIVTAAFDHMDVSHSIINGNRVSAVTRSGVATAGAGGISNIGVLTLDRSSVSGNIVRGGGATGTVLGGGINNTSAPDGPPDVQLTLTDDVITHNKLINSAGLTAEGGGISSDFPVVIHHTIIKNNSPDQCHGC